MKNKRRNYSAAFKAKVALAAAKGEKTVAELAIDGTISEAPEFFALLSTSLKSAGHQVHVVTYRDPNSAEETKQELADWNIQYDALHLPCSDSTLGMGEWKGEIAEQLNLDMMIDDSLEVLAAQPKGVLRMWVVPDDVLR